jgi:hypothetical protein
MTVPDPAATRAELQRRLERSRRRRGDMRRDWLERRIRELDKAAPAIASPPGGTE